MRSKDAAVEFLQSASVPAELTHGAGVGDGSYIRKMRISAIPRRRACLSSILRQCALGTACMFLQCRRIRIGAQERRKGRRGISVPGSGCVS